MSRTLSRLALGLLLAASATIGTAAPAQASCAPGYTVENGTVQEDPGSCLAGTEGTGTLCVIGYRNGHEVQWTACAATRPGGGGICAGDTCVTGVVELVDEMRKLVIEVMDQVDDVPPVEVCTPHIRGQEVCITTG